MSKLATAFLLLVATGLIIFVATTPKWSLSGVRFKAAGSPLFEFEPSEITSIIIKNGDQSFLLKRADAEWVVATETEDIAAPEAIKQLFQSALGTLVLDRIDASEIRDESDLSEYGVLKSSLQIDFKGDKNPSLLVGKTSADGTRHYVCFKNSKIVFLIPTDLVQLIMEPPSSFRDRRLTTVDPSRLNRLEIHRANTTLELNRSPTGWQIVKPIHTPADESAVGKLVDQILHLRLKEFVNNPTTDPLLTGTAGEKARIKLYQEGDSDPSTITIGQPAPDGGYYTRIEPRHIECRILDKNLEFLSTDISEIRDRSTARLNPDLIDLVRISNSGVPREIKRSSDREGRDSQSINQLVEILQATKVITFLPATPVELEKHNLNTPLHRLTFLSVVSENTPESPAGEQVVLDLAFAAPLPDGSVPIHINGSPEIFLVPDSILNALTAP